MADYDKTEQEAYERGYDIEELALRTQSGKRTLRELQEERDSLEEQNQALRGRKQTWMILTLVVSAILLTLCGVFWYVMSKNKSGGEAEPTKPVTDKTNAYRICEDVESKIREFNAKNGSYTASLKTVMDKEYVAFSYGNASSPEFTLLYRNEYLSREDAERGEYGSWMMTAQMIDYEVPYTLADDWSTLTPEPVIMGGTKYVLFVQQTGEYPTSVVVLEPGLMNVGKEQGCFDAVKNWFKLELGEEAWAKLEDPGSTPDDDEISFNTNDLRKTVMLTTGHGNRYAFAASDEVLEQVREKGNGAFSFGERFSWSVEDDGLHIVSPLYVREGEYYGEVTATILPVQGTLKVSNATVGAYVSYNYADADFNGVNTPAINYIENPVSIPNGNDEKLYLPEYKKVAKNTFLFDKDHYWQDETGFRYFADNNGKITSMMGVDVSEHDKKIDWKKMKDAGIKFAFVRVGYRGPGEGTLELDKYVHENIQGALENGLYVGVCFCTQAITEAEAIAEAEFVLNVIKDYDITWPVVFDTEEWNPKNYPHLENGPRGNNITRNQRTAVTKAFLDRVADAGYQPMVYSSVYWSILNINRDEISEYPFWLANYVDKVSYRYDFNIWQYTSDGKVNGLTREFDLNVLMKPWPTPEATPTVTPTPTPDANTTPNGEPSANETPGGEATPTPVATPTPKP